ncbi:MAG: aminotransferase class III-fold pyridoxal phosphate-dependent enzyme, partial [Achromobacter sp.]|nr:aminotransferase class III-fold pyridoxal phosphate-dependent enzyme [Achromobacter sp.]
TVQGEGGVNVATLRWLQELQRLCRRHDMLLIVDDIQVGCGRTGTFFSFEAAGIRPDIITLSKSLSGFGLPMSLVLMKPELDVWKPGAHSGTFRGNNLAFVTATQALETYWTNAAFTADIQRKERQVRDWLENLVHSYPNAGLSVRGRGLIQGLVCNATPALANRIAQNAFKKGVVIETSGAQDEVLKLLPALTIEEELLGKGLEVIEASVAEALAEEGQSARILKFGGKRQ